MILEGKKICFLGDSMTEGYGLDNIGDRYDNVLCREYSLSSVKAYGINGSRLAHQRVPSKIPRYDLSFCARMYDIDKDADVIVVWGGANDYAHGDAPLGDLDSSNTPATFCGAVNFLMSNLKALYPAAKIVFMTPARICFYGMPDTLRSKMSSKGPDAQPLLYYVDVIIRAGEKHEIPVLDLYREFEINTNLDEHARLYTTDGVHYNAAAHKMLAHTLAEFLLMI